MHASLLQHPAVHPANAMVAEEKIGEREIVQVVDGAEFGRPNARNGFVRGAVGQSTICSLSCVQGGVVVLEQVQQEQFEFEWANPGKIFFYYLNYLKYFFNLLKMIFNKK